MAIDSLRMDGLRRWLSVPEEVKRDPFGLLKEITSILNSGEDPPAAQELILLALEQQNHFGRCLPVLNGLVREVGLFPYLDPTQLSIPDRFAYEFHRPLHLERFNIVFHGPQAHVYRELMAGRSVVLSAPTSFGKSLITDAVVASGRYENLLIIVPTIALIDETRRRLARFQDRYKIITHAFQKRAAKNILILTQERVLELQDLEDVDFFVLDEFYKLMPERGKDERCALLNQALYRLIKRGIQFYMLGPTVLGIVLDAEIELQGLVLQKPYNTVVSRLHRVDGGEDEMASLVRLCRGLVDPTIVFCRSPGRAAGVAKSMIEAGLGKEEAALSDAADWIADNYHPDWHFVRALRRGIGIHHGRIPRALAQYVVRSFNSGYVGFLICTSTLIEGVNTKAKNIVVLDNKIDGRKYNMFTFNNVRGRAGRMFEHFVGDVYLFHDPPPDELPLIDIPAITQPPSAPTSLLIQLDEDDLNAASRDRLLPYAEQEVLGYDILRRNVGISPDQQLAVAQELTDNLRRYHRSLRWTSVPTWDQLVLVCELIWKFFEGSKIGSGSMVSPRQLAMWIKMLSNRPSIRDMVQNRLEREPDVDEAVGKVLDFVRLWANLNFPRLLRALDRIQGYVFTQAGMVPGDFEPFASQVENLYLDPTVLAVDEYGIPIQLARKLIPHLKPKGDLDEVLSRFKSLSLDELDLEPFEHEILYDTRKFI